MRLKGGATLLTCNECRCEYEDVPRSWTGLRCDNEDCDGMLVERLGLYRPAPPLLHDTREEVRGER